MSRLADDCSLIFDSGTLGVSRQGSTIVDLQCPGEYLIIREGSALDETEEVLSRYGLIRRE
jgi:tRNA A37 threonylcarbamoyladenosine synthetase subunit TsaC/SUA5/YrdC